MMQYSTKISMKWYVLILAQRKQPQYNQTHNAGVSAWSGCVFIVWASFGSVYWSVSLSLCLCFVGLRVFLHCVVRSLSYWLHSEWQSCWSIEIGTHRRNVFQVRAFVCCFLFLFCIPLFVFVFHVVCDKQTITSARTINTANSTSRFWGAQTEGRGRRYWSLVCFVSSVRMCCCLGLHSPFSVVCSLFIRQLFCSVLFCLFTQTPNKQTHVYGDAWCENAIVENNHEFGVGLLSVRCTHTPRILFACEQGQIRPCVTHAHAQHTVNNESENATKQWTIND